MNPRKENRLASLWRSGCALGVLFALMVGCDSDPATSEGKATSNPEAVVAAQQWTLSGVLQFPEKEVASNLKLVATANRLSYSKNAFASAPVPLVLSGTPPTATFRLSIDSRLPTISVATGISLMVFQDDNGNDVNDPGEKSRSVNANTGCAVWCGGLADCTPSAAFLHSTKGSSGTGANGAFTINTTGWYYQQGCRDYSCAKLVTAGSELTGSVLVYSYYNNAPIQE